MLHRALGHIDRLHRAPDGKAMLSRLRNQPPSHTRAICKLYEEVVMERPRPVSTPPPHKPPPEARTSFYGTSKHHSPAVALQQAAACKIEEALQGKLLTFTDGSVLLDGIIVGILFVLVFLGTLVDAMFLMLVNREFAAKEIVKAHSYEINAENHYVQVLRAFSAYRNFRMLMNGRRGSKTLAPVAGITSMSFIWVIIGSTLLLRPFNLSGNLKSLREVLNDPPIQFAINNSLAIDAIATVIAISISYSIVRAVRRCGSQEDCSATRYFRCALAATKYFFVGLLPLYMLLLLVINAKFPTLGSGPTWSIESKKYLAQCDRSWQWNVLFINNFFPTKDQCMPHTWFLAFVFQALIFSIAMGFLLIRLPKFAMAALGVCTFACSVTTFAINNANDLGPTALLREYRPGSRQAYHDSIEINFYTRGGPFCIGLIVGYLLAIKPKLGLNKWAAFAGWILSLVTVVAITNIPWFWNKEGRHMRPGGTEYAIYDAFHRLLFSVAVAYIALVSAWGSGGVIRVFLTWPGWLPISRLCFVIYILHPFLIFYFNGTTRGVIFYTVKLAMEELLWNVMACIIVSIPVHLLFEAPFVRLGEQCSQKEDEDSVCDSMDSMDIALQEKNAASKYS
ncbi:hypothetical protein HPB51_006996 [Rhipicephalus microplus]|uniref:Acyltransferase 3 domain-containing protein n=1 Tax=Rhipicephalus microplus TaxID=6941 RepID=A0A9J6EFR4_RHIMP|nr:hypothetical protein HPB51_006996 [Rhipicephalus microplus]